MGIQTERQTDRQAKLWFESARLVTARKTQRINAFTSHTASGIGQSVRQAFRRSTNTVTPSSTLFISCRSVHLTPVTAVSLSPTDVTKQLSISVHASSTPADRFTIYFHQLAIKPRPSQTERHSNRRLRLGPALRLTRDWGTLTLRV